ncbi:MAG TPA: RDD family protein [Gammaproteobacteria bacterium]
MGDGLRYAGFWRRLAAALIDQLLLLIVLAPLLALFTSGGFLRAPEASRVVEALASIDWLFLFLDELLPLLLTIFFWVHYEATPGKQLLDCYVVDATTFQPLSVKQALLRYLGYLVSLLPLGLGFLWIAIDPRKRGFHDLIAGSVVVFRNSDARHSDESQKSLHQLLKESS